MNWAGCVVSADCGEIGLFGGKVTAIDDSDGFVKLKNATLDGKSLPCGDVTLRISEIKDLKIITQGETEENDEKQLQFELETKERSLSPKKNYSATKKFNTPDQNKSSSSENKRSFKKKNKECFNTPLKDVKVPNFDFEKNLKLFDKEAIFEELRGGSSPSSSIKKPQGSVRKLRHDENVLDHEQEPVNLRQIVAPVEHVGREYYTDEGVIVPCISVQLRNKLIKVSENMGLTEAQRIENAGLCACQMALQLVGGSHRLTQRNAHQVPHVVVLAGPNIVGIQAICAARHLANHKVQVTLAVPVKTEILVQHLALFFHTGSKLISSVTDLPKEPVDLVIHALLSPEEETTNQISATLTLANQWANVNKAPVLLLEPCSRSRMGWKQSGVYRSAYLLLTILASLAYI